MATHGPADDVRYVHQVVVDHVGEVVRRVPVALHDDVLVLRVTLAVEAVDDVADLGRPGPAPEPDDVGVAAGRAPGRLLRRNREASARVKARVLAVLECLPLLRLDVLLGAEAAEGVAGLDELV